MATRYPGNGIYVVQGEVSALISSMRKVHWSVRSYREDENNPLLKNLMKLKTILNQNQDLKDIELITFLEPFLDVIKSNETSIPVTILALSSVNKFISYGLIGGIPEKYLLPVIENIANTVADANFITTDILMNIVEVSRTLVTSILGRLLSNDSICNIMLRCFKICFETQLNELLRHNAEHCLKNIVQMLFSRLPDFIQTPADKAFNHNKKMRIRSKSNEMKQKYVKKQLVQKVTNARKSSDEKNEKDSVEVTSVLNRDQSEDVIQSPHMKITSQDPDTIIYTEDMKSGVSVELPSKDSVITIDEGSDQYDRIIRPENSFNIQPEDDLHPSTENTASNTDNLGNEILYELQSVDDSKLQSVSSSPVPSPSSNGDEAGSREYINSQGVRFMIDDLNSEDWLLAEYIPEPHNSVCVQELLRFLTVICNPYDKQNTDIMIHIGLSLLTIVFEVGAEAVSKHPTLLTIVKNTLCRNLLSLLNKEKMQIFTSTLHVSFLLFESMRSHLKFQMEYFMTKLTEIIISDASKMSYEKKELALDCLVQLWRIPGFVTELFINYDCDLYCSNLYEDITKLLSKNVYPVVEIYSTHLLSLDALLTIIDGIEKHCHGRITNEHAITEQNTESVKKTHVSERTVSSEEIQTAQKIPNHEELMGIKRKKKLLTTGTDYFNEKPSKGIQFLQKRGLLSDPIEPAEVATFLRENPRLDKKQIGEYVSHRSNFKILEQFVKSFDFTNMRIDEALRAYLEAFRLPGEAPLISEVMQQFANHWHLSNGEPFSKSDAAYVLAYAIILLNVDQHNQVVRRQHTPMTLEDFKKNLKGTDDGKDFNQELLDDIYKSIKNHEIVMPAEQTGLVRENYLWEVMLRRSSSKSGVYIQTKDGIYDHELFSICWGPVVTALSYVFDKANDSAICNNCMQGFGKCATISAYYGMNNEFDNLTLTLCKFTALVNPIECPETFIVSFGMNPKSRLAARNVFELVHRHGDILREGWRPILSCIFQLFRCNLLPKMLTEAEDFLELSGKVSLIREDPSSQKPVDRGIFESLYSYIASAADVSSQRISYSEEQEFTELAKDCIIKCRLENLVADSKFLRLESLQELLKVLIRSCYNADNVIVVNTKQDEDKAIFFLELLLKVVLQNRDRISSLWPMVHDHLHALIIVALTSEQQFLIERCVIGLLGLAIRLTRRDEISSEVLQSLRILFLLKCSVLHSVGRQISYGLYELLKTGAANIHTEQDWSIIFTLFEIVGAGAPMPKLSPSTEENTVPTSDGMTEASGPGYDIKQPSETDSKISQQALTTVPSSYNSHIIVNDRDESENAKLFYTYNDLLPHDPFSLIKCCESLAFLVRDVAHITPFNFKSCIHTMRTFVEATLFTGERKNKKRAENANDKKKKAKFGGSKNQNNQYEVDESDHEEYPDSYFQVPLQLLDLMHTLHTKTADIHNGWTKEKSDQEIRSLWLYGWRPLLQGIARLCCDPRKTVRSTAMGYLQKALLTHDLQKLRPNEWQSCFNYVIFPLLEKLGKPLQGNDYLGFEEARIRVVPFVSKVFLQHLSPLQLLPSFTNLWLNILEFMNHYMNLDKNSDELTEAIHENVKNMILVMENAQLFTDYEKQTQFWNSTWENVDKFLPNLKDEISRYHSAIHEKQDPVVPAHNHVLERGGQAVTAYEKEDLGRTANQADEYRIPQKVKPIIPINQEQLMGVPKQLDTNPVKHSVTIFPHMGQLISTPIGPSNQTYVNQYQSSDDYSIAANITNSSHTQISSLIASTPECLARLPAIRTHSPPILQSAPSLPEIDTARQCYSISTSPDRTYSPPNTAINISSNQPFNPATLYSLQRSSSVCETFDAWRPHIAPDMRTESVPVLSEGNESHQSVTENNSTNLPTTTAIPVAVSGTTLPIQAFPSHNKPNSNICEKQKQIDPQSTLKDSWPPVYSGFSQLGAETVANLEENSATQFFYRNW